MASFGVDSSKSILAALILLFTFAACGRQPSSGPPTRPDWLSDLDYLEKEMPRRHKNLFHALSPKQFKDSVGGLKRRVSTLTDFEIAIEIAKIGSSIRDGHSGVDSLPAALKSRLYPFRAYLYSNGLHTQAIAPEHGRLAGARILAIDDTPTDEAIHRVRAITDGTNDMAVKDFLVFRINRAETLHALGIAHSADSATLTLEQNGERARLVLTPLPKNHPAKSDGIWVWMGANPDSEWVDSRKGPAPLWLKEQKVPFVTSYLPENRTLYVRCNVIADTDKPLLLHFQDAIRQAREHPTDRFVLDLRMNGGGDNTLLLPIIHELIRAESINQRGKLFVIIGRRTQSAAQNFINLFELHTNAIFVGEPSGESPNMYGDPIPMELPSSRIVINLSSLYWQDVGPLDHRLWTGPEIAAELSSDDYAASVDPALNAIRTYTLEPGFKSALGSLLMEQKSMERALKYYEDFQKLPTHRFFNTDQSVTKLVDSLIEDKRFADAVDLLRLHAKYHPRSFETFERLGTALEGVGQKSQAAQAYSEAVKLNPNAWSASDRLRLLTR